MMINCPAYTCLPGKSLKPESGLFQVESDALSTGFFFVFILRWHLPSCFFGAVRCSKL